MKNLFVSLIMLLSFAANATSVDVVFDKQATDKVSEELATSIANKAKKQTVDLIKIIDKMERSEDLSKGQCFHVGTLLESLIFAESLGMKIYVTDERGRGDLDDELALIGMAFSSACK